MHDLNYFRDHLEVFAEMAKRRNITLDLEGFRALDKERRELITENEKRKAQRNKASEEIARLKKEKKNADALLAEMKQVSEVIKQTDESIDALDARQRELLLTIPNIPHSSVPYGSGAEGNQEVRRWGNPPKFDFQPKPHWEVGEKAGILDLEAAARITGRASPSTKAGARGLSGPSPTSFWTFTPASTATRKFSRHFWSTPHRSWAPDNCRNLPPTFSKCRIRTSG